MSGREARRRLVIVGLAVVTVAVNMAGCAPSRGRKVHDEGEGVLSASSGSGGSSIYPTPPPPWTASFGTFLLCVRHPGQSVRIDGVRADVAGSPLEVKHVLRVVPPAGERRSGFAWGPYQSSAAAFPRSGVGRSYGGTLRPAAGAVISQTCASAREAPANGYTDLLTELTVDARGGEAERTFVDYTSSGRRYTLVIRWKMTACGTQIREHCGHDAD